MTYLLKKGNLVFKTIHDTGCVDIVAIDKRGNIHLYDVKTSLKYAKGKKKGQNINRVLTPLQKKLKVELLMVDLEEERCWVIKQPETLFRRPLNYSQAPLSVIPRPLAKNIPYVPLAPDPSPRAGSSSC
jgi:hypothetical protein